MTKKIAVLINEDTMQRCSCGGCLKAFMNKADSFERYADEDIELVGFTHSGGDLAKNRVFQEKRCYYGSSFYVYAW